MFTLFVYIFCLHFLFTFFVYIICLQEEEEEIEEISTEGARANGLVSSNRGQSGGQSGVGPAAVASNPLSLKTEMNKVDVIVDGRPVAGMYQVVHHRIETISTTNAVVPRAVIDVEQQVRDYFSFVCVILFF